MCLSEGYKIYDGKTSTEIRDYFATFGLKMPRFANPADKLSNIASLPGLELREGVSIMELTDYCKSTSEHVNLPLGMSSDFSQI